MIKNAPSNILIWNKDTGFLRINEGTCDNLFPEDIAQGCVDYIMLDHMEFDGMELIESDGIQILLTELYQSKFHSTKDVIQYLIDKEWIANCNYIILYEENLDQ